MGINRDGAAFLALARAAGTDFSSALTLGRQAMFCDAKGLGHSLRAAGLPATTMQLQAMARPRARFADGFLGYLGADEPLALDYSEFEGAQRIHDLNTPIPAEWRAAHSVVIDGGTSEHVAQFLMALENSMRLVAPDGHLVVIVPANQRMGHGFYQVSPELYFRVLCPPNGFSIECALLKESGIRSRWFRAEDPAALGRRVQLASVGPVDLFVLAKRVGTADVAARPLQSDYDAAWEHQSSPVTRRPSRTSRVRSRLVNAVGPLGAELLEGLSLTARAWRGTGLPRTSIESVAEELKSLNTVSKATVESGG